jgi:hypothetical protein
MSAQPKLSVSAPGDPFERDADDVADRVTRMPDRGSGGDNKIAAGGRGEDVAQQVIAASGRALEPATREDFEQRLGADFGNVRVHTDTQAADAASAIGARAFTVGSNVVFGAGEYAPSSGEGRRLLAHELTRFRP